MVSMGVVLTSIAIYESAFEVWEWAGNFILFVFEYWFPPWIKRWFH